MRFAKTLQFDVEEKRFLKYSTTMLRTLSQIGETLPLYEIPFIANPVTDLWGPD